jgi:GWxTD domain-containing protein
MKKKSKMRWCLFTCLFIFLFLIVPIISQAKKKSPKELPDVYRKWLEEEVAYIISQNEREVFLQLESNKERDMFIEAFWKQRDPNPNLPGNKFKEEHYRRIKYSNQWFGRESPGEGWRSDMGRIYIILGDPNYIEKYENETQIHPTIIWFYEGMSEYGLPNSFNVVFFKSEGVGEYELYSPLEIGPQNLLIHYVGDPADYMSAYNELIQIEPAVAQVSLSLIPTEAQYINSPSIASEILISQKIPKAPYEKVKDTYAQKLLKYKDFIEVDYSANYIESDAMVRVFQDESGIFFVHYLIEPSKFSMENQENIFISNFEVNGSIENTEGKTIYQYERKVPIELTSNQLNNVRQKLVSFQDAFPLIEGSYKFNLLMKNTISKEFTSFEVLLNIPSSSSLIMSDLTFANKMMENSKYEGNIKPFLFGKTQFVPSPRNDFCKSEILYLFFQIFSLTKELKESGILRYTLFKEEKEISSFDKKIGDYSNKTYFFEEFPLSDLSPANYRVKVSFMDPNNQEILSSQSHFYITHFETLPRPWVISFSMPSSHDSMYDNILGNQYHNAGELVKAQSLLEEAFNKKPSLPQYGMDLARFLFGKKEYQRVKQIALTFVKQERNEFLSILARSFQELKEYEQAINYYKKCLSQFGTNIPIINSIGDCYYHLNNLEEALIAWERSLQINPNQPELKEKIESIKNNEGKRISLFMESINQK